GRTQRFLEPCRELADRGGVDRLLEERRPRVLAAQVGDRWRHVKPPSPRMQRDEDNLTRSWRRVRSRRSRRSTYRLTILITAHYSVENSPHNPQRTGVSPCVGRWPCARRAFSFRWSARARPAAWLRKRRRVARSPLPIGIVSPRCRRPRSPRTGRWSPSR